MRKWYEYKLFKDGDQRKTFLSLEKNCDFGWTTEELNDSRNNKERSQNNDHYKNKDLFFEKFFKDRYIFYDQCLRKNLSKNDNILSVASGRCVNELRLLNEGYKITCSDLDMHTFLCTNKIFDNFQYFRHDVLNDTIPKNYDSIFSLSLIYLFNQKELDLFFDNMSKGLKIRGKLIIDSAGSEDNVFTFLFHEIFLRFESNLIYFVAKLLGKKYTLEKREHGYRHSNKEIIESAKKYGLEIICREDFDFLTEFTRSYFLTRLGIIDNELIKKVLKFLGTRIPYIRMFEFKKTH